MSDADKNQHLSPILSNIPDYGPEGADSDSAPSTPPLMQSRQDAEREAGIETGPTPRGSNTTLLLTLSLLVLAAITAVFAYWQITQTRELQLGLSELSSQAGAIDRPPSSPGEASAFALTEHSHAADPGLSDLPGRVDELQAQLAQLEGQIAALKDETAALSDETAALKDETAALSAGGTAPAAESPAAAAGTAAASADKPAGTVQAGQPAASGDGPWFINLVSFEREADARRWAAGQKGAPYPLQVVPVTSGDRALFRVRVGGFATRAEAKAQADTLAQQWSLKGLWVSDK